MERLTQINDAMQVLNEYFQYCIHERKRPDIEGLMIWLSEEVGDAVREFRSKE